MLTVTLLRSGKNNNVVKTLFLPSCSPVFHEKCFLRKPQLYNSLYSNQKNRYFHVSVVRKDMEAAFKMIGAGIAATGVIGPGIGMGLIFGNMLLGISRNPSIANKLFQNAILGAALCESLGLFALVISFIGAL